MGAREPELFELLRVREAADAAGETPPRPPEESPGRPVVPRGTSLSSHVLVSRRTLILLVLVGLALCILSGFVGYALAG